MTSEPTEAEIIAYEEHLTHDAHPSEYPECVHCNPPHTAECNAANDASAREVCICENDTSNGFTGTYRLSEEDICYLLCSAWEGGSNYWAESDGTPYRFTDTAPGESIARLHLPVNVWDNEADVRKVYILDYDAIQLGVSRLAKYPHHLADILNENDDAGTGDVFLQLCLFGEIVYG